MARRKPSSKTPRKNPTGGDASDSVDLEAAVSQNESPNAGGQSVERDVPKSRNTPAPAIQASPKITGPISVAILLHLAALLLSYGAIIEPSSTHSKLLDAATPYLRSTHFSADGRPFYLAHATPDERPHRLQYASGGTDGEVVIDYQTEWTTVDPSGIPGLASSDRYGRWMALVATLAQSDRPSLAAALLMPLVSADDSIDAIRVIRLPTELTTAEEDAAPPVYLARVVRGAGSVRLVSIGSKRLSTYPRLPAESPESDSDSEQVQNNE